MDVYLPNGTGPFPAIIYIHGGGWVEGNRSDFNDIAQLYAKRGLPDSQLSIHLLNRTKRLGPKTSKMSFQR